MVKLNGWSVERMKGKRRNRQETGTEHPKITKQHSIQIRPENASTFVVLMHFVAQYR
jgi:hypothetical protein